MWIPPSLFKDSRCPFRAGQGLFCPLPFPRPEPTFLWVLAENATNLRLVSENRAPPPFLMCNCVFIYGKRFIGGLVQRARPEKQSRPLFLSVIFSA